MCGCKVCDRCRTSEELLEFLRAEGCGTYAEHVERLESDLSEAETRAAYFEMEFKKK